MNGYGRWVLPQAWSIYHVTKQGKVELKRKLQKQRESQR